MEVVSGNRSQTLCWSECQQELGDGSVAFGEQVCRRAEPRERSTQIKIWQASSVGKKKKKDIAKTLICVSIFLFCLSDPESSDRKLRKSLV